ncbi:MAG: biotin--[acetyl-CoA-carboxylase] ligase [Acidobacteriia bacterium]|nr:biotin--[acetyl-CoA-carboxylase] ligase [Terriglobia bacterium]
MTELDLSQLRATYPQRRIEYYDATDSTMLRAAGRPLGTIVIAGEQTSGQGRHGHRWHSEPASGIYMSMVLQPQPLLTMALGLATAEAITSATGVACDLRWPNDVMLGDKKAAGILVQLTEGRAIGGIGINVNHTSFPAELTHLATSLRVYAGREFSRTGIVQALLSAVDSFAALDTATVLRLFTRASSYVLGRRVVVDQPAGAIEGVTAGLTEAGYLVVRKNDGTDSLILAGGVRAARS